MHRLAKIHNVTDDDRQTDDYKRDRYCGRLKTSKSDYCDAGPSLAGFLGRIYRNSSHFRGSIARSWLEGVVALCRDEWDRRVPVCIHVTSGVTEELGYSCAWVASLACWQTKSKRSTRTSLSQVSLHATWQSRRDGLAYKPTLYGK